MIDSRPYFYAYLKAGSCILDGLLITLPKPCPWQLKSLSIRLYLHLYSIATSLECHHFSLVIVPTKSGNVSRIQCLPAFSILSNYGLLLLPSTSPTFNLSIVPCSQVSSLNSGYIFFADSSVGFIAIGWQSYLSWLNQRAANAERNRRSLTISGDEIKSNR